MQTGMSETSSILVVGGDEVLVSTTVDALRKDGWSAVGTSDPWEAILLVSQRSISLIVQDLDLKGFGGADFTSLLSADPALNELPTIFISVVGEPSSFRQDDLLAAVRNTLTPSFPSEEDSRSDTRFVRRSRQGVRAGA